MRVLLKLFVESQNLGKAINALSEGGISGFYLKEYQGMSPDDWKGFLLAEEPEMAVKIVNELSQDTVVINSIVNIECLGKIKEMIRKKLENDKYTLVELPVLGMEVNSPE
ncbi:MJ1244 family protein [Methanococcus sp. CF]